MNSGYVYLVYSGHGNAHFLGVTKSISDKLLLSFGTDKRAKILFISQVDDIIKAQQQIRDNFAKIKDRKTYRMDQHYIGIYKRLFPPME